MRPAFSVVVFTTLAGAAQGLLVTLAMLTLMGVSMSPAYLSGSLALAELMLLAGLLASSAHLGHPQRAWRAVLMWRTSWLSREVIALPVLMVLVALWWLLARAEGQLSYISMAAGLCSLVLWYCTAMIYACLKFIEEWAQPLTRVNFVLIGMSSGLLLACALAVCMGQDALAAQLGPWALVLTVAAGVAREMSLRVNAGLVPKSTLQSATGIAAPRLVQKSMGMTGGSFNTREFFHGQPGAVLQQVRWAMLVLGFALPAALALCACLSANASQGLWLWPLALVAQAPGLLAERWLFFAQARHPQNLYYQTVG